jgi:hypothetical protein
MNGACIATPFGYRVHYFSDLNFCLCPANRKLAFEVYNPASVAHWLVAEGLELLFEPDWKPLEIEL